MEIEKYFHSAALAVGLKPSARQGEARLRGLERIIYSKTISPRLWKAKPACAGYSGVITKDNNPWLRSGKPCGLDQPRFSRIWQGYLKRQPRRGFHALREGLWKLRNTSGMRPCRGAEALGYGRRSPPARAIAESLLKTIIPG